MWYKYEVAGTSADNQTWTVSGTVESERAGEFLELVSWIMFNAFSQVTNGQAVYGHPGVRCKGPYQFTKFLIQHAEPPYLNCKTPEECIETGRCSSDPVCFN